ncbi:hypothetical protein BKI52_37015 [marine bacterium AO1-C]|nr:hypothetical protein BKI52_37015 [marine bacterium AO1-C]
MNNSLTIPVKQIIGEVSNEKALEWGIPRLADAINYISQFIGYGSRGNVLVASDKNFDLTETATTLDGVDVSAESTHIFLFGQNDKKTNGLYVLESGAWVKHFENLLQTGDYFTVDQGTYTGRQVVVISKGSGVNNAHSMGVDDILAEIRDAVVNPLMISSDGVNVGVGTASPLSGINNAGLHISRGGHSTLMLGDPVGTGEGGIIQTTDGRHRVFIGANIYDDGVNSWRSFETGKGVAGISVIADQSGDNPEGVSWGLSTIDFIVSKDEGAFPVEMTIRDTGSGVNVGIGTTTPAAKLDVRGNLLLETGGHPTLYTGTGTIELNRYLSLINSPGRGSASGLKAGGVLVSDSYAYANPGKNDLIVKGNVGIGTASPEAKLHVNGAIRGAQQSGAIRVSTSSGYVDMGPMNNSWMHFQTDRPRFYFNTGITVDSGAIGSYDEDLYLQTSGTTRVYVQNGSGKVGIGTTSPAYKLHAAGDIYASAGWLRVAGHGGVYFESYGGGWNMVDSTWIRTYGNKSIYQNTGTLRTDGRLEVGPNGGTFGVSNGGNVGIGTTVANKAKLQIEGSPSTYYFSVAREYNRFAFNGYQDINGVSKQLAIYASKSIAAPEVQVFSDVRIKDIQGISNADNDLDTLMSIEVTDYTFKDKIAKGNRSQKKAIAQQIEEHFPQAVSTITDVVPDIYQMAEINDGWVQLETDLKVGEKVKLIFEEKDMIKEVTEVNEQGFKVKLEEEEEAPNEVFVYGREVDDFKTVDYEALSTLNISATQAMYRKLLIQEKQLNEANQRTQRLETINQDLENRLITLEKLVLNSNGVHQ